MSSLQTYILSIETSCDETAIAILAYSENTLTILSSEISSQIKLHAKWGGVVPNLAAREHVKNITPLLELSLKNANIEISQIDAIAVTKGPGLIPALMVGVNYAKTLSYLWKKPLIGIHHIEGHIYANFIGGISNSEFRISNENAKSKIKESASTIQNSKFKIQNSDTTFPILALVVSGGHTQLVLMKDHFQYEIIGQTVDDAVGEAFDKVARILGIGYPGGPVVSIYAEKFEIRNSKFETNSNFQNLKSKKNTRYEIRDTKYEIRFPRPMLNKKNYNFSFSGLKTAVLYEVKKFAAAHGSLAPQKGAKLPQDYIVEVCHEFQQACIDVLVAKTLKAAEEFQPKTIMLAGGVSANKELREQLGQAIQKLIPNTSYIIPSTDLTGDNAAMIGAAAALRFEKMSDIQKKKALSNWKTLQADANLKMK